MYMYNLHQSSVQVDSGRAYEPAHCQISVPKLLESNETMRPTWIPLNNAVRLGVGTGNTALRVTSSRLGDSVVVCAKPFIAPLQNNFLRGTVSNLGARVVAQVTKHFIQRLH